jgi:hypothetical protein
MVILENMEFTQKQKMLLICLIFRRERKPSSVPTVGCPWIEMWLAFPIFKKVLNINMIWRKG